MRTLIGMIAQDRGLSVVDVMVTSCHHSFESGER